MCRVSRLGGWKVRLWVCHGVYGQSAGWVECNAVGGSWCVVSRLGGWKVRLWVCHGVYGQSAGRVECKAVGVSWCVRSVGWAGGR